MEIKWCIPETFIKGPAPNHPLLQPFSLLLDYTDAQRVQPLYLGILNYIPAFEKYKFTLHYILFLFLGINKVLFTWYPEPQQCNGSIKKCCAFLLSLEVHWIFTFDDSLCPVCWLLICCKYFCNVKISVPVRMIFHVVSNIKPQLNNINLWWKHDQQQKK